MGSALSTKEKLARSRERLLRETAPRKLFEGLIRRRAAPVEISGDFGFPIIEADLDGFRFAMPAAAESGSLYRRFTERKRLALDDVFLRHAFASGGALLDIGANVGLTCIPHAVIGDFAPVVAVEPEARNFACLEWNAASNQAEVVCRRAAVSSKAGQVQLQILAKPGSHRVADAPGGEPVQAVTVDQLAGEIGRLSLVKVDVQGGEADVLRGAGDLLGKCQAAWHIEIAAPSRQKPEDAAFIVSVVEKHFDTFMDTRCAHPEIIPVRQFREYLCRLDRAFTDFALIP